MIITVGFDRVEEGKELLQTFLVAALAVDMEWEDGTKEVAVLRGRVPVNPSSELKKLVGKKWKPDEMIKLEKFGGETLKQLLDNFWKGIELITEKKKLYGRSFKGFKLTKKTE